MMLNYAKNKIPFERKILMSQKTVKNIRVAIGTTLSVLLIISGILLIISCISIYNIGDRPFTPENISSAFSKISIPLYITLGAVLICAIIELILPREEIKHRASPDKRASLARMENRVDYKNCDPILTYKIKTAKKLEQTIKNVAIVLSAVALAFIAYFTLDPRNFTENYNHSVIYIMALILPWLILCGGILLAYFHVDDMLLTSRIKSVKEALASEDGNRSPTPEEKKDCKCNKKQVILTRVIVLVIALGLLAVGIFGNGMRDVLDKAINICTECIGLG